MIYTQVIVLNITVVDTGITVVPTLAFSIACLIKCPYLAIKLNIYLGAKLKLKECLKIAVTFSNH